MIRLADIGVVFRAGTPVETTALAGLDVEVPEGQFVTVIGSNGAGKSTMLNVVAGTIQPSRGRVEIDGIDVTTWPAPRRARLVARVFQNPTAGSCEALSIEENLALAATRTRRRGLGLALTESLRDDCRKTLARLGLGLEHRLGEEMGLLSGGQRQAVSLLMATLGDTRVLLLDEHTAALDPKTGAFVLDLTRQIVAERRLTTVMVTHSMRQALEVGDRTLMLHQGRVVVDVVGAERARLDVADLVRLFERVQGETLSDDALLL